MSAEICKICGYGKIYKIIYLDKFDHVIFKNQAILVCQKCGFGEITPKINKRVLSNFYKDYYYSSEKSPMRADFKNMNLRQNILDYRSISQILLGYQYMSCKENYSFLDIGAGLGNSFSSVRKILKNNVKLFAVEENNDAKEFYEEVFGGITVLNNLSMLQEKIDIILMSHSLEHFDIDEIPDLFDSAYNILSNNGIVIIEVPQSDLRNDFLVNRRFNDTPHLSFFSLESLRNLALRSRFELCFINTAGQLINIVLGKNADMPTGGCLQGVKEKLKRAIKPAKKILNFFRIDDALKEFSLKSKCENDFYNNSNFKYGGDRDLIRCVLRKR